METIRLWIHRDGSQSRRNITADARTVLIGKDNRCNGKCLAGYGKTLSAMKAFPTDSYADAENGAPYIEYSIVTKQAGDYEAEFYMQPSNPVTTENRLQYAVSVNGVPMQIFGCRYG